jgi:hypothetical protein
MHLIVPLYYFTYTYTYTLHLHTTPTITPTIIIIIIIYYYEIYPIYSPRLGRNVRNNLFSKYIEMTELNPPPLGLKYDLGDD